MDFDQAPTVPATVDVSKPNSARLYDWYLGGKQNFAADREFGKRILAEFPLVSLTARSNRRWLGRVVRAAARSGISQFLDLGAGVPTVGNVYEIAAHELGEAGARVVYVDNEHVAAAHAQITLEQQQVQHWCGVVQEDYRHPEAIRTHPETQRLLDRTQPICVLFASVLHFIGPGDDPAGLLHRYRAGLAPGSWVAVSQPTDEIADPATAEQLRTIFDSYTRVGTPSWLRTHREVASWFDGFTLVEPGLVRAPDWRPDIADDPAIRNDEDQVRDCYWCAVGKIPASAG